MSEAVPGIHRGFRDVDAENRAQDFAAYLQGVAAQMAVEKTAMQDLLEPRIGQRLLDVGCGVGDDVRALAGRVVPTGTVVGIDASTAMIDEARSRNAGPGIEFQVADAHSMPFPDNSFDAARTERTLQHVESPVDVLAEMARVVRPGGLLTASEPDWGTLAVDAEDHLASRDVVQAISENHIRNGWIGRQLCGHFVRLGLEEIEVHPVTLVLRSFTMANQFLGLSEVATQPWLQELHQRDRQGTSLPRSPGSRSRADARPAIHTRHRHDKRHVSVSTWWSVRSSRVGLGGTGICDCSELPVVGVCRPRWSSESPSGVLPHCLCFWMGIRL